MPVGAHVGPFGAPYFQQLYEVGVPPTSACAGSGVAPGGPFSTNLYSPLLSPFGGHSAPYPASLQHPASLHQQQPWTPRPKCSLSAAGADILFPPGMPSRRDSGYSAVSAADTERPGDTPSDSECQSPAAHAAAVELEASQALLSLASEGFGFTKMEGYPKLQVQG